MEERKTLEWFIKRNEELEKKVKDLEILNRIYRDYQHKYELERAEVERWKAYVAGTNGSPMPEVNDSGK